MTFSEYYQHYLSLHQKPWTRRLHVLGQLLTIGYVGWVVYLGFASSFWWLLLLALAPFVIYPVAWYSHFYVEKNKPAAFKNPLWAKACDWVMLWEILLGRLTL